jgi:hypothetical protein
MDAFLDLTLIPNQRDATRPVGSKRERPAGTDEFLSHVIPPVVSRKHLVFAFS